MKSQKIAQREAVWKSVADEPIWRKKWWKTTPEEIGSRREVIETKIVAKSGEKEAVEPVFVIVECQWAA